MERDLLIRFKSARETVGSLDEQLKAARAEEREAEQAVIDYLEAKQATATAKFEGLGWAQINAPRLFANATVETWPAVIAWLKAHGHEAAVRETVHLSTLSQIVGEALREGVEVPGTTHYFKPNVRLYP